MKATDKEIKSVHAADCKCSICGHKYKGFAFKHGYVCESCLDYIKSNYSGVTPSGKNSP